MATAGKHTLIKVGTAGAGPFSTVMELNDGSMSLSGDNQDITEFGDDFINRIQGLKDCSFSLAGFYNPTDINGQKAVQDALLNDTSLFAQFLYDGVNGFQQEVKVGSFEVSSSVDGVVELSIDLEGTGAVTAVP